ncbi:TBP-interacting_protein TIP49 [Hexamita inflata]|uniref:RuvB-like helicase n=1 Tax=Hexamita inflata TaxID=28002 RepID=A0AA86PCP6_9EUKA|nr:TBP-interacting protein TIP49 [Hexamita inflata]CAI9966972.1 TBP-interacting protein TIP49 [Hexamita inflata]
MILEIENVRSDAQRRVDAHSHIKKLGLDESGQAIPEASGFVGQCKARESMGIAAELIKQKKLAGRSVLLAGPSGTGKTALALGLARELGDVPFSHLVASEVYSAEVKKSEVLMEHFRRAIGLRIKEEKEVFEGEVIKIQAQQIDGAASGAASVQRVNITLATKKAEQELKLDGSVYQQLEQQNVKQGDVIYIESNSGLVKRLGRADKYVTDSKLENDQFVPVPQGEVHKKKEIVQHVTLHDLDVANAQPKGGQDLVSILNQFNKIRKTEITDKLRQEIDKVVQRYIQNGVAELNLGLLFIDECHLLDLECFSFLNKALESPLAPICVFASNRGVTTVRGTDIKSAHGIPSDLLDRMLIVQTLGYFENEIFQILKQRADVEQVKLTEGALKKLAQIGTQTSLRYAMQLISACGVLAEAQQIEVDEQIVQEVRELFLDTKEAIHVLENNQGYLM